MKKAIVGIFVLVLSVFVFASCGSDDFDVYSLDIFGVFTPEVMKQDPERLYEKGVDNILRADEYSVEYSFTTKASGDGVTDKITEQCEKNSGKISLSVTNDAFSYITIDSEQRTQSVICVDGISYTDKGINMVKSAVTEAQYKSLLNKAESVLSILLSNFDDDTYENVKIKQDGDLYKIEFPVDKGDGILIDETFTEGSICAWFDDDKRLVKYVFEVVLDDDSGEDGAVRYVQTHEMTIKLGEVSISAPKNANQYQQI